jgi:hypothetical protein
LNPASDSHAAVTPQAQILFAQKLEQVLFLNAFGQTQLQHSVPGISADLGTDFVSSDPTASPLKLYMHDVPKLLCFNFVGRISPAYSPTAFKICTAFGKPFYLHKPEHNDFKLGGESFAPAWLVKHGVKPVKMSKDLKAKGIPKLGTRTIELDLHMVNFDFAFDYVVLNKKITETTQVSAYSLRLPTTIAAAIAEGPLFEERDDETKPLIKTFAAVTLKDILPAPPAVVLVDPFQPKPPATNGAIGDSSASSASGIGRAFGVAELKAATKKKVKGQDCVIITL